MHDLHLLADFLIIVSLSVIVVWLFHKIKLPSLVGFLAAGVLIGPGGMAVIADPSEVELLAEIGVVLLLFSIGLEFSLRDLMRIRRLVFGGGGMQLLGTAAIVAGIAMGVGIAWNVSLFWGALVGLSSTAIVLSLLQQSGQLSAVHGQGMLGILIFQDLAVVALILLAPIMAGQAPGAKEVAFIFLKAFGVIVGLMLLATYVYPWFIEKVVKTRQRELFTLLTILVGVGTAYLSGLAGLSLALGAFLAGLVISESPYSHQMLSEVLPFRDLFNSLFFVSVGMLFSPTVFMNMPFELIGLIVAVFVIKALIAGTVILVLGYGLRVAVLVGIGLAQVGEFSFVLAREGLRVELLSPDQYSVFLAVSVITMAATPLLFRLAEWLAERTEFAKPSRLERLLAPSRRVEAVHHDGTEQDLEDHVIVVGYGLNGKNVARVLRRIAVPYVIVEMNSKTVRDKRDEEPIYFGDAARQPILKHLGIEQARSLVVAIGDAPTTRRIVAQARRLNPELFIVVRTRYEREVDDLYELGASEVIPEEFETSLELVGSVLESYGASPVDILREKDRIRREAYGFLRMPRAPEQSRTRLTLKQLIGRSEADIIRVPRGGAVEGKTLRELNLRAETGASIVGVVRQNDLEINPPANWILKGWDELVILGKGPQVARAREMVSRVEEEVAAESNSTNE
ncbi:sodium:proton exchanger [Persicimonas caeni]|uniref:Sodium:proton exchanger n=1 Tax=Persicimonas caeni TaxID=2292766 RepID=A0A4Y6PRR3_PERCE|nr:monovalent cation:proton antiporter family protein [Persicimonas caeni]QDG50913.1 sodium:proton exchanger [Persicimonas caeni]QED32134.1 sodium:proton exchanger [Persicimonas caeni]